MITIYYTASDGFKDKRRFRTLAGARRYAQRMLGTHPEFGFGYAVSEDGTGTLRVVGCDVHDLFN